MLRSAYRFSMTSALTSLLGERPVGHQESRRVPGGLRMYLQLADGAVTAPGPEKEAELLRGIALDRAGQRTAAALLEGDPQSLSESGLEGELRRHLAGAASQEIGARRVAVLDWVKTLRQAAEDHPAGPAVAADAVWLGLEGTVKSSGGWPLLREDGVLALEARFTIETQDGSLLSVQLNGHADLTPAYDGCAGPEAFAAWARGKKPTLARVPLSATMQFDASGDAGAKAPFMASRYRRACAHYWKYVRLSRGQFVATGTLGLTGRPESETGFADSLELHGYELLAG
jgi:hypothetical protein